MTPSDVCPSHPHLFPPERECQQGILGHLNPENACSQQPQMKCCHWTSPQPSSLTWSLESLERRDMHSQGRCHGKVNPVLPMYGNRMGTRGTEGEQRWMTHTQDSVLVSTLPCQSSELEGCVGALEGTGRYSAQTSAGGTSFLS